MRAFLYIVMCFVEFGAPFRTPFGVSRVGKTVRRALKGDDCLSIVTGGICQIESSVVEDCVLQAEKSLRLNLGAGRPFHLGVGPVVHPELPPGPLGRVCIVAGCNDDDSDYLSFTLSGLIDSALENGLLSAPIVTYVVSKDQIPDDLKANGW